MSSDLARIFALLDNGYPVPAGGGGGGGGAAAETVDVVAGETLAVGDVALLSAGVGTAGRAYKADSDSSWLSSRAAILGIVTVGASATGTATIQTSGTYSGGGLISMTPGLVYGLSSTAGGLALTGTRPWLGIATASDEIILSGRPRYRSGATTARTCRIRARFPFLCCTGDATTPTAARHRQWRPRREGRPSQRRAARGMR